MHWIFIKVLQKVKNFQQYDTRMHIPLKLNPCKMYGLFKELTPLVKYSMWDFSQHKSMSMCHIMDKIQKNNVKIELESGEKSSANVRSVHDFPLKCLCLLLKLA